MASPRSFEPFLHRAPRVIADLPAHREGTAIARGTIMKKQAPKKLELTRSTLRTLTHADLSHVAGGFSTSFWNTGMGSSGEAVVVQPVTAPTLPKP